MITIYTTSSCSSCRKAIAWMKEHNISFREKNIFTEHLTIQDLHKILKNTENGYDDIISTRSKVFAEKNLDLDNMKTSELEKLILENPSILRRPIIIDDEKIQVGYNDDDIRVFIPRELRNLFACSGCQDPETCAYTAELKKQFKDIESK
ncbi:MAG: transcriptional regulator Spx [Acholeplasmatales bacterium]|nr:transcriptional regulator Spx [Acholeplasmatales bacterium]